MIFDEMKVRELVIEWQETHDDELMEEILKETTSLIEVIVSSFDPMYRDDMIQVSYIKVMGVLYNYSPDRGKLHSYLTSVIRNECYSYIQHVNRNLNISDDIIDSGIVEYHEDREYADNDLDLLCDLIERNRDRFPSLPTFTIDPITEYIFYAIRDEKLGKSRGTISKILELHNVDRNQATVIYHSTLAYMRLSLLGKVSKIDVEEPDEFSLLRDFQDIIGDENCRDISILFSGMYVKF